MQREEDWEYEEISNPDESINGHQNETNSKAFSQNEVKKKTPKRRLSEEALKPNRTDYFLPLRAITFEEFRDSDSFGPFKPYSDGISKQGNVRIPITDPSKLMVKMTSTTGQIVEAILKAQGFVSTDGACNVLWTGGHLKNEEIKELKLNPYQKINHFPRTVDITRKDKLYQQMKRMQDTYGMEYGFIPRTFILPTEREAAIKAIENSGLEDNWILKPVGSSRGRGIYIINKEKKLGEEKKCIISKYIDNPLLIDGRKFDIRIYALVTSFEPLVVYIYHEGLARFATEKYKSAAKTCNRFVHLTNYSVNKMNKTKFVANEDENQDNVGSKWSYAALRSYFNSQNIDFEKVIESQIYDVVVKTFISIKSSVALAMEKCVPFRGNCFELFGFDIMFDDNYKPWLLEVNLSPSLSCDSPLDHKIKATLVADLFNMIGVVPCTLKDAEQNWRDDPKVIHYPGDKEDILRAVNEEYERRAGWVRVYPAVNYKRYDCFRETQTSINQFVCKSVI